MFDHSNRPAGRARRGALGAAASFAIGACVVGATGGTAQAVGVTAGAAQTVGTNGGTAQSVRVADGAAQTVGATGGTAQTVGTNGDAAQTVGTTSGTAQSRGRSAFIPGDLLVSRVHYTGTASMITPGVTVLPTGAVAIADGSFAHVWDNVSVDPNFGVTAPIYLDQVTPRGGTVGSIAVSDGATAGSITVPEGGPSADSRGHDLLTGSFS